MEYKRKIKSFEKKEFKESFSNNIKREIIENILDNIKNREKEDFKLMAFGFYLMNENIYENIYINLSNKRRTKVEKFLIRIINNIYDVNKNDKKSEDQLGFFTKDMESIKGSLDKYDKEKYKYILIGMFLYNGYIADPKKTYNLEFKLNLYRFNEERVSAYKKLIKNILFALDIKYNVYEDKDIYKIYIRKGDEIVKLLAIMGSARGVLRFEEARVIKSVNQELNRNLNFETSNMQKMLLAAKKQRDAINKIMEHGVELDRKLDLAAELRMKYPEASLKELSEKGSVSRSTLNQRLKRIEKIAEEIKD